MARYAIEEIVARLRRRADGETDALDGVWADETLSWRSYSLAEQAMTSDQRNDLSRRELEAFTRAMPDFTRTSRFHVAAATETVVEQTTWAGTARDGPVHVELCLIYTVNDGRITRVDMYSDSAQFERLGTAIRST